MSSLTGRSHERATTPPGRPGAGYAPGAHRSSPRASTTGGTSGEGEGAGAVFGLDGAGTVQRPPPDEQHDCDRTMPARRTGEHSAGLRSTTTRRAGDGEQHEGADPKATARATAKEIAEIPVWTAPRARAMRWCVERTFGGQDGSASEHGRDGTSVRNSSAATARTRLDTVLPRRDQERRKGRGRHEQLTRRRTRWLPAVPEVSSRDDRQVARGRRPVVTGGTRAGRPPTSPRASQPNRRAETASFGGATPDDDGRRGQRGEGTDRSRRNGVGAKRLTGRWDGEQRRRPTNDNTASTHNQPPRQVRVQGSVIVVAPRTASGGHRRAGQPIAGPRRAWR